jgi:hypothetical protein
MSRKDTKKVIRSRISKKDKLYNDQKTDNIMTKRQTIQWPKDRQYNDQKTDNTMTKRQTIQWPKDRQYNDQKKKDKKTNNDLQNITQKTKDRSGSEVRCSGSVNVSCSTCWYILTANDILINNSSLNHIILVTTHPSLLSPGKFSL